MRARRAQVRRAGVRRAVHLLHPGPRRRPRVRHLRRRPRHAEKHAQPIWPGQPASAPSGRLAEDWPRMAEARGCPDGPEPATERACVDLADMLSAASLYPAHVVPSFYPPAPQASAVRRGRRWRTPTPTACPSRSWPTPSPRARPTPSTGSAARRRASTSSAARTRAPTSWTRPPRARPRRTRRTATWRRRAPSSRRSTARTRSASRARRRRRWRGTAPKWPSCWRGPAGASDHPTDGPGSWSQPASPPMQGATSSPRLTMHDHVHACRWWWPTRPRAPTSSGAASRSGGASARSRAHGSAKSAAWQGATAGHQRLMRLRLESSGHPSSHFCCV